MRGLRADVRVRRVALSPLRRARSRALAGLSARSAAGLSGRSWARGRTMNKPTGFVIMLLCIAAFTSRLPPCPLTRSVTTGGMDNIVGISTQRGGSAKAPGDALTVHALNRGTDAVLRRVAVARVIDPARQRAVTWRRGSVVGATTSCRGWGAFSGSSQEVALDYTLYLIPA